MATEEEVKLIDFQSDVVTELDTIYVHDFFNSSWKKSVAIELDHEEREILVQYDDRSQEWIRMDGTKMCFNPPPEPPPPPPVAPVPTTKKVNKPKSNRKRISKARKSSQVKSRAASKKTALLKAAQEVKNSLQESAATEETSNHTLEVGEESSQNESTSTPSTNSSFPKSRGNNKAEMLRRRKERKEQFRKNTFGENADEVNSTNVENSAAPNRKLSKAGLNKSTEGEKEIPKLKVRFGKARDVNLIPRKKGKTRIDDLSDDTDEEMSVVINDEKLPSGWSKHMVKRKTCNKWDVIIQNEEERKFKSKVELKAYFEAINQPFPEEVFDFSSGKKTSLSKPVVEKSNNVDTSESLPFLNNKKKIKTLLPRRSTTEIPCSTTTPSAEPTSEDESMQLSIAVTPFPIIPENTEGIPPLTSTTSASSSSGLTIPTPASGSSGFICPKQDCKKHCRSEYLLMMHIRHFHQEYKSMLKSMPNVADLAYARTVGQSIDTLQTEFLEKIAKIEEHKMKEKTDSDRETPLIDEDFTLKIETDDEEKSSPQTDKTAPSFSKIVKKGTPTKKVISSPTPSSPSSTSSVLLAQLQQPPLVPPPISIQSEHTDAEFSVSQNSPIALYSPKISNKDANIKSSPLSETDSGRKSASPRKRRLSQLDACDVINCTCGYGQEDGLMMQCDLCLCWQHGACNSVENADDTPSPYICTFCQNPRRIHSSKKYIYVQNWIKDGKIPKFEFSKTSDEVLKEREKFVQKTHEFLRNLAELKNAVHSLQVKVHILRQTPDHPKLYLWATSWNDRKSEEKENLVTTDSGPVPEVAINMVDCRKHLSEHIDEEIEKAETMLQNIEDKIDKLEDDDDFGDDAEKFKNIAKQTLLMMLRDLSSIQNLKYC